MRNAPEINLFQSNNTVHLTLKIKNKKNDVHYFTYGIAVYVKVAVFNPIPSPRGSLTKKLVRKLFVGIVLSKLVHAM
jgi:hypothetical protein